MSNVFNRLSVKKEILDLYEEKLEQLRIRYEIQTIESSFGNTHVVVIGSPKAPPVIVLHGFYTSAVAAIEIMLELLDNYCFYAIGLLSESDANEDLTLDMQNDTYGQWLHEIKSRLHLKQAILMGISFGGFMAWKSLVFDQRNISKAFFINPAGIVDSIGMKRIAAKILLYQKTKNTAYVDSILEKLCTQADDFTKRFLSALLLNLKISSSPIPLITKQEAKQIQIPIYLIVAEKDALFCASAIQKFAQVVFPNFQNTLLLTNNNHLTDRRANTKVADFVRKHGAGKLEVGSRKSEVGSRRSEVGGRRSEIMKDEG